MRDSHAWRSKMLISRIRANFSRLTEFLTHRPIKCKFSSQFVKTAGMIGSRRIIFGNAQKSSETFGNLWQRSEVVGHLRKSGQCRN